MRTTNFEQNMYLKNFPKKMSTNNLFQGLHYYLLYESTSYRNIALKSLQEFVILMNLELPNISSAE